MLTRRQSGAWQTCFGSRGHSHPGTRLGESPARPPLLLIKSGADIYVDISLWLLKFVLLCGGGGRRRGRYGRLRTCLLTC